jgi:hypothetical protein
MQLLDEIPMPAFVLYAMLSAVNVAARLCNGGFV